MAKRGSVRIVDKGWNKAIKSLKDMDKYEVQVGYLKENSEIAAIASFQEFGTKRGIPSRPFMSDYFDREKIKIEKFAQGQIKRAVLGRGDIRSAMDRIGLYMKGGVQRNIRNGNWAPNAPSTIKKKGSDRPLIDTGRMIQSVDIKVDKRR